MLKTIKSLLVFAANELLRASILAVNEIDDIEGGDRSKRMESKTRRSENQKLVKSQKSSKSKSERLKTPFKSRNSTNFNATETYLSFWTPETRTTFNRL